MALPLKVGAVMYDPKVSVIWEIIRDFFDAQAVAFDPDLRRTEHMAGGMEADANAVVRDRLAVRQRLERDLLAEPDAQHPFGRRRGKVAAVAAARVVGMGMGEDGALHRPPRVDVEVALRAVQAFAALHDQVVRHFRFQ